MLHDPARHEALLTRAWDESLARGTIERIVRDTEKRCSVDRWWPLHAKDADGSDNADEPAFTLYHGAAGVIWALNYLHGVGAALHSMPCWGMAALDELLERNHAALAAGMPNDEAASYLMGDTPILMMAQGIEPKPERADRLAALIERNIEHPAREILWGAPGTMLAALFLHERFGSQDARWAELFRRSAARLWSQLEWSQEHGCHFWTQDMYGQRSTYIDAVHGFVGTGFVVLRGGVLLTADELSAWQRVIETTVVRTVTREDGRANWRPGLTSSRPGPPPMLMQYCHGAPGFVFCLAPFVSHALDALLLEAGEAIWHAGPLAKGSNLCHGTGGNGYAFLKLYERSGDARWLERARAFAMHGIAQVESDERAHGQQRYSLWTGDPGFAIYLWDCIRGCSAFPTLDVFYAPA